MPEARTLERDQTEIAYDAGSTSKVDLPREHFYQHLNCVLDWQVTTGTSASQSGNGILDLIENIKVEYNGDKTPKSQSFAMSHFIDKYEYGSQPLDDRVDFSTASTQSGRLQTYIQFLLAPGAYGAMLPSFLFSGLTLEIKWANASDVGSDVTVDSATLKVNSMERKRHSLPEKAQKKILENGVVFKETELRRAVDNDGTLPIDLPQGNVYHSMPFQVHDGDAPSNDLIASYEVSENGVDTHKSKSFDLQQADDYQQYRVDSITPGLAFLNYAQGNATADAVDTRGMDSYKLKLETAAAPTDPAEVRLCTREIIPNRDD